MSYIYSKDKLTRFIDDMYTNFPTTDNHWETMPWGTNPWRKTIKETKQPEIKDFKEILKELYNSKDALNSSIKIEGTKHPLANIVLSRDSNERQYHKFSLALAGYSKDNISLEVDGNTLKVSGNHGNPKGYTKDETLLNEIALRKFSRTFTFMSPIHIEDAEFKDGMLTFKVYEQRKDSKKVPIL